MKLVVKWNFKTEKDDFVVVFYRNLRDTWGDNLMGTLQDTPQDNRSDTVTKILAFCKIAHSRTEIMEFLALKDKEHFRKKYIKPLLDQGLIKMTLPDKPNSKYQKYVAVKKKRNNELTRGRET